MQKDITKKLIPSAFLLSIILHLLFLLSIIVIVPIKLPYPEPPPHDYVPSYLYQGAITPSQHKSINAKQQPKDQNLNTEQQEKVMATKHPKAITLPSNQKAVPKNDFSQRSILDVSREILRREQMQHMLNQAEDEEPILLIGDKNKIADPLIRLIGRALSAHFKYPEMEGNFGITGRVIVEMVIHPEGFFSDIRIIRSSENGNLDAAALYAVNTAPTVKGLDNLLNKPKHLVVGFIFN